MKTRLLLIILTLIPILASAQGEWDMLIKAQKEQTPYLMYSYNPYFKQNQFIEATPVCISLPTFSQASTQLPQPYWKGHDDAIKCYWRAWEITFSNLKNPTPENNFVSPYIDPAFNKNIFMWDCSFMTLFGRYGSRAFNFQGTLDNFYRKQHPDGFICREIYGLSGKDCFERHDPSSTGPNIMPWVEWEYFQNFNDTTRLTKVFDPLMAYCHWFKINRTWKDGSYYLSGWGCGMDNQPRVQSGYSEQFDNGHMSWIDATLQEIMANTMLIKMAKVLGREKEVEDFVQERDDLITFVNEKMWNTDLRYYVDRFRDGSLSKVQSIASYWALLAEAVPENRLNDFVAHLEDTTKFNRPHRIPTLAADCPQYDPKGGYWCGAVWAPTNYMVLRGLTTTGKYSELASKIGRNHHQQIVDVFNETGTFYENYAPESIKGNYRTEFVGWTGLVPISVLFEYVFGIQSNVPEDIIEWRVNLTDEFGINNYPFGTNGIVNLQCKARKSIQEKPSVKVSSNMDLTVRVIYDGGSYTITVKGKKQQ